MSPEARRPAAPARSQTSRAWGVRITGMRSWIGATSSFGAVVSTVKVSSTLPRGPCHRSHSPAKPNGAPPVEPQEKRLLAAGYLLPLVEAVRGHQTAPPLEAVAKRRLLRHRLRARVDHPAPDLRILRPVRNQPPAHLHRPPRAVLSRHHHRRELGRRHVVARRGLRVAPAADELRQDLARIRYGVTAAHDRYSV